MSMFGIHFAILSNSGEGDGFMSSEFQHTLRGRGMADTYADVAIGSVVTIRHVNTQGGYLHSHPHIYPGGSKRELTGLQLYALTDDIVTLDRATDHPLSSPGHQQRLAYCECIY